MRQASKVTSPPAPAPRESQHLAARQLQAEQVFQGSAVGASATSSTSEVRRCRVGGPAG